MRETTWPWSWLLMVKMTRNYPDNIVLMKTDIDLDMSRSYIENVLSQMNDN